MNSLNRPEIAQTTIVSLTTFAALLLLGWVLAYWTWGWFSPQTELHVQTVEPVGRVESASGLFGKLQVENASPGNTIQLLGVIAASGGGSGYAVIGFANQPIRPVKEGEEIAPGIRLSEVHPDKVILERSGLTETVVLPTKKMPAKPDTVPILK